MHYTCAVVIKSCFNDSVNCVSFSPDGLLIASACEDGRILVHTVSSGAHVGSVNLEVAATALTWLPDSSALFVGLANCQVFCLFLDCNLAGLKFTLTSQLPYCNPEISALYYHSAAKSLVVGFGCDVVLVNISEGRASGIFQDYFYLSPDVGADADLCGFEVRGIALLPDAKGVLIGYLEAGIVACSVEDGGEIWKLIPKSHRVGRMDVNPSGTFLICSNLHNGVDIYDIQSREYLLTVPVPVGENLAIPVKFIYSGNHALVGSTSGRVRIITVPQGLLVDELEHPNARSTGDIIQAIDWASVGTTYFIATASLEKSDKTYMKIWVLDSGQPSAAPERLRKRIGKSNGVVPATEGVAEGHSTRSTSIPQAGPVTRGFGLSPLTVSAILLLAGVLCFLLAVVFYYARVLSDPDDSPPSAITS